MGKRDGIPEAQSGTSPADGDKKEKGDSGVDSRGNGSYKKLSKLKVSKNSSEGRRTAHALKGWGAVLDPPCAG